MGTRIYYFSSTGNSLQIARDIAREMNNAVILPMICKESYTPIGGTRESIGFIFPIYYNGLPRLVKHFIQELIINPDTYCFAVAASGGTRSNTLAVLDNILTSKGARLSFADEVKMPGSYIIAHNLPHRLQVEKLIAEASIKTKRVAKSISHYELQPAKPKAKLWSKIVNYSFLYRNIHKWDKKFAVTQKCVGCGLCAKVCPAKNIEMDHQRPFWKHNCERCLACLHWCPCAAIEYGKNTVSRTRYHHPNIAVEDIVNSRRCGE